VADKNVAVNRGRIFNTPATLNVDLFAADIRPSRVDQDADGTNNGTPRLATAFRITVCLAAAAKLRAHMINSAEVSGELNSGVALAANAVYTFTIGARNNDLVNFQLDTSVTVKWFYLDEVIGETL